MTTTDFRLDANGIPANGIPVYISYPLARELMEEIDQYAEKAAEVAMELMPGDTNVPCE